MSASKKRARDDVPAAAESPADVDLVLQGRGRFHIDSASVLTCTNGTVSEHDQEIRVMARGDGAGSDDGSGNVIDGVRVLGTGYSLSFGRGGALVNGVSIAEHNRRERAKHTANPPTPVRVDLSTKRVRSVSLATGSSLRVTSKDVRPQRLRVINSGVGGVVIDLPAMPGDVDITQSGVGTVRLAIAQQQ